MEVGLLSGHLKPFSLPWGLQSCILPACPEGRLSTIQTVPVREKC